MAWFRPLLERPEMPLGLSVAVYRARLREAAVGADVAWEENLLRHSFGTYHVVHHRKASLTAEIMGNCPGIVRAHYANTAAPEAAAAWWAVLPADTSASKWRHLWPPLGRQGSAVTITCLPSPARPATSALPAISAELSSSGTTRTVIYRSRRSYHTKANFQIFTATELTLRCASFLPQGRRSPFGRLLAAVVNHIPPKGQQRHAAKSGRVILAKPHPAWTKSNHPQ